MAHDYLRAVGFRSVHSRQDLQQLLNTVMVESDADFVSSRRFKNSCWEKSHNFIPGGGITVRGEVDDKGTYIYDYYFPHFHGRSLSVTEDISIEKHPEREDHNGVCDVMNLGVTLIFHMNKLMDYSDKKVPRSFIPRANIRLSALSTEGTILIPIKRDEDYQMKRLSEANKRKEMISAAQNGDPEALEKLTIEELDLYADVAKRIGKEDILSIVESYFIPYGISSDQYSVLGDILSCEKVYNNVSGELVYVMLIQCNDLLIDLCINSADIMGAPAEGRRFKGVIWLQGELDF